jgi:hypothetical protein
MKNSSTYLASKEPAQARTAAPGRRRIRTAQPAYRSHTRRRRQRGRASRRGAARLRGAGGARERRVRLERAAPAPHAAAPGAVGRHHRHPRRRDPRQAGQCHRGRRHAGAPVRPHPPGADLGGPAPHRHRRAGDPGVERAFRHPEPGRPSRPIAPRPEPYDKAGAYGIQGLAALFIEHIEGSHSGIMGLPVFETAQLLRKAGVEFL